MDSMSIIPLLSDGKYCVEEQVLQSIVSKARENECIETEVILVGHKQDENISRDLIDPPNCAEETDDNEVKTKDPNDEIDECLFEFINNDLLFTDLSYESLGQDEQLHDHYVLYINKIKV